MAGKGCTACFAADPRCNRQETGCVPEIALQHSRLHNHMSSSDWGQAAHMRGLGLAEQPSHTSSPNRSPAAHMRGGGSRPGQHSSAPEAPPRGPPLCSVLQHRPPHPAPVQHHSESHKKLIKAAGPGQRTGPRLVSRQGDVAVPQSCTARALNPFSIISILHNMSVRVDDMQALQHQPPHQHTCGEHMCENLLGRRPVTFARSS